jgi:hypothetical protein
MFVRSIVANTEMATSARNGPWLGAPPIKRPQIAARMALASAIGSSLPMARSVCFKFDANVSNIVSTNDDLHHWQVHLDFGAENGMILHGKIA